MFHGQTTGTESFLSLKNINNGKVKANAIRNVPSTYSQKYFMFSFLISSSIQTMAGTAVIKKSKVMLEASGVAVPCLKYSATEKGIPEYKMCWRLKYQGMSSPRSAKKR
jgi:hypothetical protein